MTSATKATKKSSQHPGDHRSQAPSAKVHSRSGSPDLNETLDEAATMKNPGDDDKAALPGQYADDDEE